MFHFKKRWVNQTIQRYPKIRRAGVLLYYQNEFLIIHQKSSGFYGFPKGRLEYKENPILGAMRELKEETGVEVELNDVNSEPLVVKLSDLNYFYFVEVKEKPEVKIDGVEIDGYMWGPLTQLKSLPTSALTKKILELLL
jgi:tRNA nucleotidyltransferase (CCA-adding enzyme)